MRVGILLILLQSVLLCAEARAEGQVLQAETADKTVRALLLEGDSPQPEEPDAAPPVFLALKFPRAADAPIAPEVTYLFSAADAAQPIRGPPARQ